jgi:hypothetical protein
VRACEHALHSLNLRFNGLTRFGARIDVIASIRFQPSHTGAIVSIAVTVATVPKRSQLSFSSLPGSFVEHQTDGGWEPQANQKCQRYPHDGVKLAP